MIIIRHGVRSSPAFAEVFERGRPMGRRPDPRGGHDPASSRLFPQDPSISQLHIHR